MCLCLWVFRWLMNVTIVELVFNAAAAVKSPSAVILTRSCVSAGSPAAAVCLPKPGGEAAAEQEARGAAGRGG